MVKVAPAPLMMPVIEPAPLLVIDSAGVPEVASAIAPALKVPVLMVRPVSGVAPITPLKVVAPVVVVDKVLAPVIVELKRMAPALLPVVNVVVAPRVTAPLYVCAPLVVMLLAKVLVPLTTKLEVPVVLVIAGLVPFILSEPTVRARCKSREAMLLVKAAVVIPPLPPKLPELVTVKVPPLMVVEPP